MLVLGVGGGVGGVDVGGSVSGVGVGGVGGGGVDGVGGFDVLLMVALAMFVVC